jgi:plasmid stability protein
LAPLDLNLDDDLIARLKRRAARHGRSTEAEHREILRQALINEVEPSFENWPRSQKHQ